MTRRSRWLVAAGFVPVAAFLIVACNGRPKTEEGQLPEPLPALPVVANGPDYFADVTLKSSVQFQARNGQEAGHMSILETLGSGAALFDFDGDGKIDLFIPGGGYY